VNVENVTNRVQPDTQTQTIERWVADTARRGAMAELGTVARPASRVVVWQQGGGRYAGFWAVKLDAAPYPDHYPTPEAAAHAAVRAWIDAP
jgi:hypothetical protein